MLGFSLAPFQVPDEHLSMNRPRSSTGSGHGSSEQLGSRTTLTVTPRPLAAEQPVLLAPEPDGRYDRNAIAIRSADGRLTLGHVPRGDAAWCRRTNRALTGIVWEYRHVRDHDRTGLRVLIAPAPIGVEAG